MKSRFLYLAVSVLAVFSMLLTACGGEPTATVPPPAATNTTAAAAAGKPEISADGATYTVTLKSGLKSSDGQPVTAHNYEYAFRRLFDPNLPGREYASVAYDIKGAADLDVFTDTTNLPALQKLQ